MKGDRENIHCLHYTYCSIPHENYFVQIRPGSTKVMLDTFL